MGAQRDNVNAKKRSGFVGDQAIESDEEDMLGFGGVRKKKGGNDDDDDEQDADGVVKALMDNAHMDEMALAKSSRNTCVSIFWLAYGTRRHLGNDSTT